jgi:hypothetical protein
MKVGRRIWQWYGKMAWMEHQTPVYWQHQKVEKVLLENCKISKWVEQETLSKEEQAKFETNQSAWTALILASRHKVFTSIVGSVGDKDTYTTWEQLKKEVIVPNKAKDFAKMNTEFLEVRMKDKMGFPKRYIRELQVF